MLRKEPAGREVSEEDVFHVNSKFVNKKYRIKINQIQMKETPEENKKTTQDVFQDRQYQARFLLKMMDFLLSMMDFLLKRRDFLLKRRDFY